MKEPCRSKLRTGPVTFCLTRHKAARWPKRLTSGTNDECLAPVLISDILQLQYTAAALPRLWDLTRTSADFKPCLTTPDHRATSIALRSMVNGVRAQRHCAKLGDQSIIAPTIFRPRIGENPCRIRNWMRSSTKGTE